MSSRRKRLLNESVIGLLISIVVQVSGQQVRYKKISPHEGGRMKAVIGGAETRDVVSLGKVQRISAYSGRLKELKRCERGIRLNCDPSCSYLLVY